MRQFLATESPLTFKNNEKCFLFHLKNSSFSRYLNFCLDFLVSLRNGLIRKMRLISKFMTSHFRKQTILIYYPKNFFSKKSKLSCLWIKSLEPAGKNMFKVNNRNTRKRCEICSKLTIKTPEWRHWRRSGVFIVNFEHISHVLLVFLLLTLIKLM